MLKKPNYFGCGKMAPSEHAILFSNELRFIARDGSLVLADWRAWASQALSQLQRVDPNARNNEFQTRWMRDARLTSTPSIGLGEELSCVYTQHSHVASASDSIANLFPENRQIWGSSFTWTCFGVHETLDVHYR